MKTFYSLFLSSALLLSLLVTSCADQLNINPKGVLADDLLLGKPEHIDDFVTPCYSLIPYLPWSDRLSSLCGTLCYSVVSYDTPSVLLSIKKRKKIHPVTLVTNYLYLISDLCPLNNKR